jgi:hypothetical protein
MKLVGSKNFSPDTIAFLLLTKRFATTCGFGRLTIGA